MKTYSPWNEVNHKSQPTFKSPKRAAQYYNEVRKGARKGGYRVMAADLLDTGNFSRYLSEFKRHVKGSPKLWGLHNYGDVNYRRSTFTRPMLRSVPGEVWLTETGGIVKLLPQLKRDPKRAAKRTGGCSSWPTSTTRSAGATARRSRGCSSTRGSASRGPRASTPAS